MGVKPVVIRSGETPALDKPNMRVFNVFNTPDFNAMSVAVVEKRGVVESFQPEMDMIDYVLDGEGEVTIENERFTVRKGDLVFVPRGTHFTWSGGVTLLAITTPRYR